MTDDPAYRATALGEAYAGIDQLPVTVLLDNVRSLYNVGAFFRTADAVRAEAIILAGITPTPEDPRIAKTALGAERSVAWSKAADAAAAIDGLRARGHEIAPSKRASTPSICSTGNRASPPASFSPRSGRHSTRAARAVRRPRADPDIGHEGLDQRGDGRRRGALRAAAEIPASDPRASLRLRSGRERPGLHEKRRN